MERSKTQNNQWNATPIDKMRFIKSSSVPNGKNGIVIIDKWQTTLGQTIYTKTFHPQNISTWLITQQKETLERDYFELGEDWDYFEHQRHFMAEKDDWGDLVYFADGEEKQKEEWNELLKEADVLAGAENGYFPSAAQKESACSLDKDSIKTALLQPPTAEEAALWQP